MSLKRWLQMRSVRRGVLVLHWVLALLPIGLWIGLVGMAARAAMLLGKVPQPSIDDPYQFGQTDAVYQGWIGFVEVSAYLALLSLIPWICLTALTVFAHWHYWSKDEGRSTAGYRFFPIGLYFLAYILLILDPIELFAWFLD